MFNPDPNRPLIRIVAGVAGLAILCRGLRGVLSHGSFHYENWFGELVFAPVAILFGVLIILVVLFKPEILGRAPRR